MQDIYTHILAPVLYARNSLIMKKYARLLLVPVVLGSLAAGYQMVLSPTDVIVAELRPLLSPAASIVLPTEDEKLFSDLTRRYMQVFQPDIAAVVRVGTESDVPLIVRASLLPVVFDIYTDFCLPG